MIPKGSIQSEALDEGKRDSMSIEENIEIVKGFFAAIGSGDKQRVLALVAEDIEWIIPGEDWPLAGKHRAHAGVRVYFRRRQKRSR